MNIIEKPIYEVEKNLDFLPPLVKKIVCSKELSNQQLDELFEEPVLSDPYLAEGILEAGKILKRIKENHEKILICGDYDADGICSTTILVHAFHKAGIECGFYIPDRLSEGYGLNTNTVKNALAKGYKNFITVDNGVKAIDAMKLIRESGATLILTDHHHYDENEIVCDCFVHPFLMSERFKTLSGAGVACLIARMLLKESKEAVILAAIAAIADCMPMFGETRSIVRLGLKYLNQGYYPAVNRLKNNPYDLLDEGTIGFQIAPKLNGTGRMADIAKANNTVRYLLSSDEKSLESGSKQINEVNEIRKQVTVSMVDIANRQIEEDKLFQIVSDHSFHEGVVGLVASRLSNELKKPVMVLALKNGEYKGSIRSVEGLDLTEFFNDCKHLLKNYGGHTMAAGIGFSQEHYEEISSYIHEHSRHIALGEEKIEVISIDEEELSISAVEAFQAIRPFGNGFEEPIFKVAITIKEVSTMSKNLHLKVVSDQLIEYVYFNQGKRKDEFHLGEEVIMIGCVSINNYRNQKKISFNVMETLSF